MRDGARHGSKVLGERRTRFFCLLAFFGPEFAENLSAFAEHGEMLRDRIREQSRGWIRSGHLDLTSFQTLGQVRRRLLTDQSALRELVAGLMNPLNIQDWRRDLETIAADLRQVEALIQDYGEEASLT
jgi:hypothetical protein